MTEKKYYKKLCPLPYTDFVPGLLKKTLLNLPNKAKILEIGCGEGAFLFAVASFLKKENKTAQLVGVDIAKDKIVQAKKYFPYKADFYSSDAAFPHSIYKRKYDLIISYHVIEHIKNLKGLFQNIKRASSKTTILFATSILKSPHAVWIYRRNGEFVLDPTHYVEYKNKNDYFNVFKKNGFEIIEYSITPFSLPITMLGEKIIFMLKLVNEKKIRDLQTKNRAYQFIQKIRIPIPGYKMIHITAKKYAKIS